jgi:hypothetical protein
MRLKPKIILSIGIFEKNHQASYDRFQWRCLMYIFGF